MPRVRVLVRPKAGILDPQGQVVERALPALGFAGVTNVHVGRLVELDVEEPTQVEAMCERLLTNPLVEDYEVQVAETGPRPTVSDRGCPGPPDRPLAAHAEREPAAPRPEETRL